jgi:hypothetical protein
MRTHTALVLVAILVAGDAVAQTPLPRCPVESAVSSVISKLEIDIIFKQAYLSEEWQKKLKDAAHADTMACLQEANAMLDMADENIRMREEIDNLKRENALLKYRIEKSK